MQENFEKAILVSTGFLLGIFIFIILHSLKKKKGKNIKKTDDYATKLKLTSSMLVLLVFTILFWSVNQWAVYKTNSLGNKDFYFIEKLSESLFGVAAAGLLGGLVFEFYLRRDILSETSKTLAEIVTTDKVIMNEIFSEEKRNEIIEKMLQLNLKNDDFGSGIYNDLLSHYTENEVYPQFRWNFEDHISICDIDNSDNQIILEKYYEVVDQVFFQIDKIQLEKMPEIFIGCAFNERGLYSLFNNKNCIYRWLISEDTELLKDVSNYFNVSLAINEKKIGNESETIIDNEKVLIKFPKPLYSQNEIINNGHENNDLVSISIEAHTLHPKKHKYISVHLAYPVKGVDIKLNYVNAKDIRITDTLYFLTKGKSDPRIGNPPILEKTKLGDLKEKRIKISNDHWLFPNCGVLFLWE